MALTRITKGVIKPNENYDTHNINSTGIVTAIGLDVNGNGDISGKSWPSDGPYAPPPLWWEPIGHLVTPLTGLALAVLNGDVYTFGGSTDGKTGTDVIQKLERSSMGERWRQAGKMMVARNFPAVSVISYSWIDNMKVA